MLIGELYMIGVSVSIAWALAVHIAACDICHFNTTMMSACLRAASSSTPIVIPSTVIMRHGAFTLLACSLRSPPMITRVLPCREAYDCGGSFSVSSGSDGPVSGKSTVALASGNSFCSLFTSVSNSLIKLFCSRIFLLSLESPC